MYEADLSETRVSLIVRDRSLTVEPSVRVIDDFVAPGGKFAAKVYESPAVAFLRRKAKLQFDSSRLTRVRYYRKTCGPGEGRPGARGRREIDGKSDEFILEIRKVSARH